MEGAADLPNMRLSHVQIIQLVNVEYSFCGDLDPEQLVSAGTVAVRNLVQVGC